MNNPEHQKYFFSFIPLTDFKALLGIDDREDDLARYCLIIASYTIEEYCRRRLLFRKQTEYLPFTGDPVLPLGEYPVRKILTVQTVSRTGEQLIPPHLYQTNPECGPERDVPFYLSLDRTPGR
jgi:hypothetical protein